MIFGVQSYSSLLKLKSAQRWADFSCKRVTARSFGRDYEKGRISMTNQQKFEIIKALAYGETPEQVAAAEGITLAEAQQVQQTCAGDIAEEQKMLREAGYLT